MANEKLEEVSISLDELQAIECGGARRLDIATISNIATYMVSSVSAVKTAWGNRVDFTLKDDWGEVILSDWNVQTKKRFKPLEIVGKTITLQPTKNPKKLLLEVKE